MGDPLLLPDVRAQHPTTSPVNGLGWPAKGVGVDGLVQRARAVPLACHSRVAIEFGAQYRRVCFVKCPQSRFCRISRFAEYTTV